MFQNDGETDSPAWLNNLVENAPTRYEASESLGATFDMADLLPSDTAHWEYSGSLVCCPALWPFSCVAIAASLTCVWIALCLRRPCHCVGAAPVAMRVRAVHGHCLACWLALSGSMCGVCINAGQLATISHHASARPEATAA